MKKKLKKKQNKLIKNKVNKETFFINNLFNGVILPIKLNDN